MAWVPIRTAYDHDHARLEAAAKRFMKGYGFPALPEPEPGLGESWASLVDEHLDELMRSPYLTGNRDQVRTLRRLWEACVAEALLHPKARAIQYGTVGYSI